MHTYTNKGKGRRTQLLKALLLKNMLTHTRGEGRNVHIVERVLQLLISMLSHTHKGSGSKAVAVERHICTQKSSGKRGKETLLLPRKGVGEE